MQRSLTQTGQTNVRAAVPNGNFVQQSRRLATDRVGNALARLSDNCSLATFIATALHMIDRFSRIKSYRARFQWNSNIPFWQNVEKKRYAGAIWDHIDWGDWPMVL